jgi:hypothetical protein
MEFIPPLMLTILTFLFIIFILKKVEISYFKKIKYSQSDIHNIFKQYIVDETNKNKKKTQLSERLDKNSVNVVILEDKAYWVVNNIFYNASFINGKIDTETIKPIDTDILSKDDLDKMLLILDKLGDGNNDSSSTG